MIYLWVDYVNFVSFVMFHQIRAWNLATNQMRVKCGCDTVQPLWQVTNLHVFGGQSSILLHQLCQQRDYIGRWNSTVKTKILYFALFIMLCNELWLMKRSFFYFYHGIQNGQSKGMGAHIFLDTVWHAILFKILLYTLMSQLHHTCRKKNVRQKFSCKWSVSSL